MKILHIAPLGEFCGIATYTSNLVGELPQPHNIREIPPKSTFSQLSERSILEWADLTADFASSYDVIHIQNEFGLFCGDKPISFGMKVFYRLLKRLKQANKNVCVTFHSEPVFLKALGLFNFEEKACAKAWKKLSKFFKGPEGFTAIVHTSFSQQIFQATGFDNTEVITHGVIETNPPKKIIQLPRIVNLSIFGYISDYKGHEFALSILELLPKNYRLNIIGGRHPESQGEEIGTLLKAAFELGVLNRVAITGWVSPAQATLYQEKTDIFLAPYQTTELSASGALTWALNSGAPIISSNIRSFRSINHEAECMLLCHPTDRLEWLWAIKRVTEDPVLHNSLTKAACQYCNKFSWKNTAKTHINLYSSINNVAS